MQKLSDERLEEVRTAVTHIEGIHPTERSCDELLILDLAAEVDRLRALTIPPEPGAIAELLDSIDDIGIRAVARSMFSRLAAQVRALTETRDELSEAFLKSQSEIEGLRVTILADRQVAAETLASRSKILNEKLHAAEADARRVQGEALEEIARMVEAEGESEGPSGRFGAALIKLVTFKATRGKSAYVLFADAIRTLPLTPRRKERSR